MAESVDALVSNTSRATCAGSTPALGTTSNNVKALQSIVCSAFFWCPVKFWEVTVWTKGRGPTAWKANKHPAQGNALGRWMFGFAPCKGKSNYKNLKCNAFALTGRISRLQQHPGRCPGLKDESPFKGIMQTVGVIPFKQIYIHRTSGVYRTPISTYIIMCRRSDVQNYYGLSLPRGMVIGAKVAFQKILDRRPGAKVSFKKVWDRCPRGCRVIL